MPSNIFQFNGTALITPQEQGFGGTVLAVDGGPRVRTSQFAIRNMDSTSSISFSFDATNYTTLDTGESFSQNLMTDRFYYKSDSTDIPCSFKVVATLRSGWDK